MLDEHALAEALAADPGDTLPMLAEMVRATDEALRAEARRLAARIVLDVARQGVVRRAGTARRRPVRADRGGDLDVDRSLDRISAARAAGRWPDLAELVAVEWGRPELALCLAVDASGSMTGERLAASALAAAACAWRAPGAYAVLSFARTVTVHRSATSTKPAGTVVNDVLALRGHGVTAVAAALQEAARQLGQLAAARRVTVLLSDCRATDEQDPLPAAAVLDELIILAPAGDSEAAADLASRSGARWAPLASAADAPAALQRLL